ncbi:MAG: MFS transporter [Bacteroidales bacterium]|nr:MFS transporter [Bacteroidales bacterium]
MKSFIRVLPIFIAFLCMGFGDAAGPLTSQLEDHFTLSNLMASLVTFAGFISFGLFSIPFGLLQDRKNKKFILMLGLIIALGGLVLPIIGNYQSFFMMLLAVFLLGLGATALQVSGNPIMRDVSPEGQYASNLSFGQFVKAIGSLSASLIPLAAKRFFDSDWRLLFPVYAACIAITIIYLFAIKVEEKEVEKAKPATFASAFALLKNRFVLLMVIGIFLYVGAEVCMSARLPNYLDKQFGFDLKTMGLWGTSFFFIALMTGRFLGGVLLKIIKPASFLVITAIVSLAGIGGLFLVSNVTLAFVTIFLAGVGFANVFPLIFSISVETLPERTNEISGLMVTAIIGGAIVPLLFGLVADLSSILMGFLVPAACLVYVLVVGVPLLRRI